MEQWTVREFLDRLIRERGESYDAVSKVIGRNPSYIQQFVKRGTPKRLAERDRGILARYFGVDEAKLGGASGMAVPRSGVRDQAMIVVPRLSLGASAGVGSLDEDEERAGVLAFDPRWFREIGSRHETVSMIRVDGESMEPTLGDGDDIMVDGSDGIARLREGIYVLRMNDTLMVKRIAPTPRTGRFSIRSDNAFYPNWDDVDARDFIIIGRVIWVGRRLA